MICITDGQDTGSCKNYHEILARLINVPRAELILLDIGGSLSRVDTNQHIVKVDKPEQIGEALKNAVRQKKIDTATYERRLGTKISVSVFPITECSQEEYALVNSSVQEATLYLESLTGLRYYPVPTYIVDDYMLKEYVNISPSERTQEDLKVIILAFII